MNRKEALSKIINKVGSGAELARILHVSDASIFNWMAGRREIPPILVRKLVEISEGEISESDLRPDIFYPINLDQKKIAAYA